MIFEITNSNYKINETKEKIKISFAANFSCTA